MKSNYFIKYGVGKRKKKIGHKIKALTGNKIGLIIVGIPSHYPLPTKWQKWLFSRWHDIAQIHTLFTFLVEFPTARIPYLFLPEKERDWKLTWEKRRRGWVWRRDGGVWGRRCTQSCRTWSALQTHTISPSSLLSRWSNHLRKHHTKDSCRRHNQSIIIHINMVYACE